MLLPTQARSSAMPAGLSRYVTDISQRLKLVTRLRFRLHVFGVIHFLRQELHIRRPPG